MDSSAYKYDYYTAEEYYAAIGDRENRTELIDGMILDLASPSIRHQRISKRLTRRLEEFVEKNSGKCEPFAAIDVKLDDSNIVVPDVMVGCDPEKFDKQKYNGAPDFVAEIVSTNRPHDYIRKLALYEISGVREYWIIDPQLERVMVYFFEEDASPKIYDFQTPIPVNIWGGKLRITINDLG